MSWDLKSDHLQEASQFPYRPLRLLGKTTHHGRSPTTQTCKLWGSCMERMHEGRERDPSVSAMPVIPTMLDMWMKEMLWFYPWRVGRRKTQGNPQQPETPHTYCPSIWGCSNHPGWDPSHWAEISHPTVSFPTSWSYNCIQNKMVAILCH